MCPTTYYLELAVKQWREDGKGIPDRYADLHGRKIEKGQFIDVESVGNFVMNWVTNSQKNKLLILGRSGSGKTILCRYLFCVFRKLYVC